MKFSVSLSFRFGNIISDSSKRTQVLLIRERSQFYIN